VAVILGVLAWAPAGAIAQDEPIATLVRVIDTSSWSPPSPDPAGITYLARTRSLFVSDSEVNESHCFRGANVFEITRGGRVKRTFDLTWFSREPAGIAAKPGNRRMLFISDDDRDRIFIWRAGPDRVLGTEDDRIEDFRTRRFGCRDPEGISFGRRSLFVADGSGAGVFRIGPGPNRRFDGMPPKGDDELLAAFDTTPFGLRDPEGLDLDRVTGHLFVVSRRDRVIAELTIEGELVNLYDISASGIFRPSGVAMVRNAGDPSVLRAFVTDRGIDNSEDPNENDGRIFAFLLA